MEIEPEVHFHNTMPQTNGIENQLNQDVDIFKEQEEKLLNRNNLKIITKNLLNNCQQEVTEINSEIKLPKKKKEEDVILHPFRHLIFSPNCQELVFKRHLTIIYRGLIYAKKCLKGPSDNYLKSKQIDLISRISSHSNYN